MPLEPAFLFSHELLQNALPELLSQTGTTGRQFAQLLIRVWQETRHNNFPDIERAAEEGGKRQMPLTLDALLELCKRHGLEIRWFDGDGRKPSGALVRSRFEAPGTVLINKRLRNQEERLKYELAFFIGHKILHNGDGVISPHSAVHAGEWKRRPRRPAWARRMCCTRGGTSNAVFSPARCCARESRSGAS